MPYFFATAYAVKLAISGEGYEGQAGQKNRDLVIAIIATIYSVWLLYAAGAKYLLLSALLYAPGAIVYYLARRENNKQVFTNVEKIIFALAVIGAIVAAIGLATGKLTL